MSGLEIWLVNDDPAQLLIQKRLLGRFAATVWDFGSPAELLAQAKAHGSCPNLVSDYNMPGINGLQLAELWCKMHPDAKILLLSASVLSEVEREELTYLPTNHVKILTSYSLPELLATAQAWFTQEAQGAPDTLEVKTTAPETYRFFDAEMLGKLKSLGGGSFVSKALERFAERIPSRLKTLEAALLEQINEQMMFEAHALKGSCGMVGASEMMNAAGRIEEFAQSQAAPGELARLIEELNSAWESTRLELEAIAKDLSS